MAESFPVSQFVKTLPDGRLAISYVVVEDWPRPMREWIDTCGTRDRAGGSKAIGIDSK